MTTGERLTQALESRRMGKRAFQRAMKQTGVRGSSYPAIDRYLRGQTEPSQSFLEHAAELLGVRLAWLASGVGEKTDAEAAVAAAEDKPRVDPIRDTIRQELTGFVGWLGRTGYASVLDTVDRLAEYEAIIGGKPLDESGIVEVARTVCRHLVRFLAFCPVDPDAARYALGQAERNDAIALACQATKRLIPAPAQARLIPLVRAELAREPDV
jgi:transcriptional regulator with XRE-family HTH domain